MKATYWAVLSCGTVYSALQGGSNFWVCVWNPKVWAFKWKLLNSILLEYEQSLIPVRDSRSQAKRTRKRVQNFLAAWKRDTLVVIRSPLMGPLTTHDQLSTRVTRFTRQAIFVLARAFISLSCHWKEEDMPWLPEVSLACFWETKSSRVFERARKTSSTKGKSKAPVI